jgi:adenine/guanine phosphoribosyltransferase-like PRPP-binding protein
MAVIDDFMKAGGTVNGMISLLDEFQAHLAGIAVLVEADKAELIKEPINSAVFIYSFVYIIFSCFFARNICCN